MRLTKNGFTTVEAVLVVAVIMLLGLIGMYVHGHTKKVSHSPVTTVVSPKPKPVPKSVVAPTAHTLALGEWDVEAGYNDPTDLEATYIAGPDGAANKSYFSISTPQLSKQSLCDQGATAGFIVRFYATDPYINEDGSPNDYVTVAAYAATLPTNQYAHIADFYYFFRAPVGSCTSNSEPVDTAHVAQTTALQNQAAQLVQSILPTLHAQ